MSIREIAEVTGVVLLGIVAACFAAVVLAIVTVASCWRLLLAVACILVIIKLGC